jgi:hypothetical protein
MRKPAARQPHDRSSSGAIPLQGGGCCTNHSERRCFDRSWTPPCLVSLRTPTGGTAASCDGCSAVACSHYLPGRPIWALCATASGVEQQCGLLAATRTDAGLLHEGDDTNAPVAVNDVHVPPFWRTMATSTEATVVIRRRSPQLLEAALGVARAQPDQLCSRRRVAVRRRRGRPGGCRQCPDGRGVLDLAADDRHVVAPGADVAVLRGVAEGVPTCSRS